MRLYCCGTCGQFKSFFSPTSTLTHSNKPRPPPLFSPEAERQEPTPNRDLHIPSLRYCFDDSYAGELGQGQRVQVVSNIHLETKTAAKHFRPSALVELRTTLHDQVFIRSVAIWNQANSPGICLLGLRLLSAVLSAPTSNMETGDTYVDFCKSGAQQWMRTVLLRWPTHFTMPFSLEMKPRSG